MKKLVIFLAFAAIFTGCEDYKSLKKEAKSPAVTKEDREIGLRKNALEEENFEFSNITFSQKAPGEAELFNRSFENAPPLIPHSLEDLLPITAENNICLSCHMPEFAADVNATAIPQSHLVDLRKEVGEKGRDLGGALAQARFECVQCHIEQSDAKPLVKNSFKADFREANGTKRSNLLEILDQGANSSF